MLQTVGESVYQGSGLIYDIRFGPQLEGPGMQATVLFKGCSFSCWWCPNPELQSSAVELIVNEGRCVRCGSCVSVCDMGAADLQPQHTTVKQEACIVCGECVGACQGDARSFTGRRMATEEVIDKIRANMPDDLLARNGVVFSGGEPLIQSRFLEDLLKACRKLGLATAVETSGYVPWSVFERVRSLVDLFLVDLKFFDYDRHWEFTGLPNGQILENIQALSKTGQDLILRVPLIPNINDDYANQAAIAAFAARLPHLKGVEILPYQQIPKYRYERLGKPYRQLNDPRQDGEAVLRVRQLFEQHGLPAWVSPVCQAG